MSAAILAFFVIVGILVNNYLNNPYRTLEEFPAATYFDSYQALSGLTFKVEVRVEAVLGWKDGVGRLMAFTVPGESCAIVVMTPPALADIYFIKGQTYLAELEVKEGGLIHANAVRKE